MAASGVIVANSSSSSSSRRWRRERPMTQTLAAPSRGPKEALGSKSLPMPTERSIWDWEWSEEAPSVPQAWYGGFKPGTGPAGPKRAPLAGPGRRWENFPAGLRRQGSACVAFIIILSIEENTPHRPVVVKPRPAGGASPITSITLPPHPGPPVLTAGAHTTRRRIPPPLQISLFASEKLGLTSRTTNTASSAPPPCRPSDRPTPSGAAADPA